MILMADLSGLQVSMVNDLQALLNGLQVALLNGLQVSMGST